MSGVPSWHDDLATLRGACDGLMRRHDALDRVEAEIARLREQATQDRATILFREAQWLAAKKRAEAAEARCARLQQALEYAEGVLMRDPFDEVQRQHAAQVLREALAGLGTPADSQPEDGTA